MRVIEKPTDLNNSSNFHTKMEKLKAPFFLETLRRWHFEALVRESGLSRERVHHFLKKLVKEQFIKRIKERGKMPYYLANRDKPQFRTEKRLYGLQLLAESGLLADLASSQNIKTAIVFGSFARGDWSKSSDIDLFIYGEGREFDKRTYEVKLGREIQLFSYHDPRQMKELDPHVIPNILKGLAVTDSLEPFTVSVHG